VRAYDERHMMVAPSYNDYSQSMAPNVGSGTAGPVQRGWTLYILSVVMVIVAGLFLAVRMGMTAARKCLGMDDWTILLSLVGLDDLTCL